MQASKAEENAAARPDDADAAHDRDFASLKSIVAEALADAEQLQRLWRSIDVTSNALCCNHRNCCDSRVSRRLPPPLADARLARQRLHCHVSAEHVACSALPPHENLRSQVSAYRFCCSAPIAPLPNLRQRLVWKFLSPSGAPLMACDFDVLLKVLCLRLVTPAANLSS